VIAVLRLSAAPATLATTTAVALAVAGCGGSTSDRVCVADDASGSTTYSQPAYTERLGQVVEKAARRGGSVVAVVATGQPLQESDVLAKSFDGLDGTERAGERAAAVADLLDDVDQEVRASRAGDGPPTDGSGIVAALRLLEGRGCGRVELYSDGLETSAFDVYHDDIVTAAGRERIVAELRRRGVLAHFHGAELDMPFGGYTPQSTKLPQARLDALPALWQLLAERSDAKLHWRR
jgi:hypothetical protein